MAALPHPRVIYVGATEYWFDAELVASCARTLPEASFAIVGPVTRVVEPLSALDNVFLLGPRPYGDIPAYLQHADVGIIPFRRDRMVDSIHPIKLYEYLASGLPVVATRWMEIEAMQAPIALAEREGFVETIRLVIQSVSESGMSAERRREFARNNSWKQRYEQIRTILDAET
jgi:glycosyltransferase involved in cell wall biosynthesis